MKRLLVATALAMVTFCVGSARANTWQGYGYVCSLSHQPASTAYGSHGNALVSIYTLPSCGGTYMTGLRVCTTGATSSACTSTTYHYTEASFNSLLQMLQRMAIYNQKLWFWSPSESQFEFFNIYAD